MRKVSNRALLNAVVERKTIEVMGFADPEACESFKPKGKKGYICKCDPAPESYLLNHDAWCQLRKMRNCGAHLVIN